eukprot:6491312-Amphidinium_carterae.2
MSIRIACRPESKASYGLESADEVLAQRLKALFSRQTGPPPPLKGRWKQHIIEERLTERLVGEIFFASFCENCGHEISRGPLAR